MTEGPQAAADSLAALPSASEESDVSSRTSGSSPGPQGNGTGVFIPACILDGSAMSNPAIAAKFPRRQRRPSAPPCHSPPVIPEACKQHSDSSPSSRSDSAAAHAQERNQGGRHARHQGSSSHSTSAKNPFAATPKNIRQQQLLCNLMAAADSFTDPSAQPGGPSRAASLDYSAMPPPVPGSVPAAGRASMDRPSLDMSSMSRATSRNSLESWGYMNRGRNSCDMQHGAGNRTSMDSYSASMRSSMDRASCWSGRPSVDSTFSAYAPASPQLLAQQQQQQQQVAATAAAAAAAAAVAARASFEAALPPTPAGNSLNRIGMWQAGRASCDLGALSPSVGASAFSRYSLDSSADAQVAAAAAAAASALQMEQQRSLNGLIRFDSSAMSNVSSGSLESSNNTPCPPSPANPAELAAAAAAMAARRNQLAQLQNIIDSMGAGNGGISTETAAALANLTAQGVSPDTAALLLMQAQQNAAAMAARSNGIAPEAVLFQQQLQQIMQANQMAAAASSAAQAAAASQLYAATAARNQASQQRQHNNQRWQNMRFDGLDAEQLLQQGQEEAPLSAAYDAASLQQQLELLQRMQL